MIQQLGFFSSALQTDALAPVDSLFTAAPIDAPQRHEFSDIVDRIAEAIATRKLRGPDLVALCGNREPQQAYNLMEAAMVKQILANPSFAKAQALVANAATQRRRGEVKEDLQQFSTVPTVAFFAASMASILPSDIVLEPSVGSGILAAYSASYGPQKLYINEIDRERLALTRSLFPDSRHSSHDALFLHALLRSVTPSVVVMNPPFSHDLQTKAVSKNIGLRHVDAALAMLAPNGRLVAILGANAHPETTDWSDILQTRHASLRLAVTIDGRDYTKMGTSFNLLALVIDKAPDLGLVASATEPRRIEDVLAAYSPIARLSAQATINTATGLVDRPRKERAAAVSTYASSVVAGGVIPITYAAPTGARTGSVFVDYTPSVTSPLATAHPAHLVESLALSGVALPEPSIDIRLPEACVTKLSNAQLEVVAYAEQAHSYFIEIPVSTTVENVTTTHNLRVRQGFMAGHGTGFGKGRVGVGIIAHAFAKGASKAVWFSETQSLFEDSKAYWKAVTGESHADAIYNLSDHKVVDNLSGRAGVMFCTYATLRSQSKQTARSRVDQIIEALGGASFDGVILFDECHNLGNTLATKSTRGTVNGTQQGAAALALQRALPNAKIVYISATAASKIEAFAYAERLGLWSTSSAFTGRDNFMRSLDLGGTGALEILCRDLKASGLYLSAQLSYEGVTTERLEHALSEEQIEQYNAVARLWRRINVALDEHRIDALEKAGDNSASVASINAARAMLEGRRLSSFQSMLVAFQLESVIPHIEDQLAAGNAPVIQIMNTYEASQKAAIANMEEGDTLDDLDVSPKRILLSYLETVFPIAQLRKVTDSEGNSRLVEMTDVDGRIVIDPDLEAQRDAFILQVNAAISPDAPLTTLIDHFGSDRVAEITGRSERLIRKVVNGTYTRVLEKRSPNANVQEAEAFMDGSKDILIFSEQGGGTGRSYHADNACANRKRRVHYVLQVGYRSEKAIQSLGRTHRTNQASAPHWVLCTTNTPGYRRFTSKLASRLDALGAATRGQREASGTSLFDATDNLETPYGNEALRHVTMSIAFSDLPISYETWLEQTNLKLVDSEDKLVAIPMSRFLNRVLACDLSNEPETNIQEILVNDLLVNLTEIVSRAKEAGTYDLGVQTVRGESITKVSEQTIRSYDDGGSTSYIKLRAIVPAKRSSFGLAHNLVEAALKRYGEREAFFASDADGVVAVYRVADITVRGRARQCYRVLTPTSSRLAPEWMPYYRPEERLDDEAAKAAWNAALDVAGDTTATLVHLVCGRILPIYDLLPESMAKVVTATLDDGERLIGRVLAPEELEKFLSKLNITFERSMSDLLDDITGGKTIVIANCVKIKKTYVDGILKYEVVPPRHMVNEWIAIVRNAGGTMERINYVPRIFLNDEDPVSSLEALRGKIVDVAYAA